MEELIKILAVIAFAITFGSISIALSILGLGLILDNIHKRNKAKHAEKEK